MTWYISDDIEDDTDTWYINDENAKIADALIELHNTSGIRWEDIKEEEE